MKIIKMIVLKWYGKYKAISMVILKSFVNLAVKSLFMDMIIIPNFITDPHKTCRRHLTLPKDTLHLTIFFEVHLHVFNSTQSATFRSKIAALPINTIG